MPLYEFECEKCGAAFELMRSVSSRPPRKCPDCGESGGVTKQVSAPAFQFKGSGW
jgi:putative FmdB family regulatory protein